jgi:hypothetical protein
MPKPAMTDEMVMLNSLSHEFQMSIIRELHRDYVVAFVEMHERPSKPPQAQLIGTGTLVSAAGRKAILTASHVVTRLQGTKERLVVFLERTNEPHSLPVAGLAFVNIAKGEDDSVGPDLGAIALAPTVAGAIAAKKLFYPMDCDRDMMLNDPPGIQDGLWLLDGFPDEGTRVVPDSGGDGITTYFYGFGAFGCPEQMPDIDGFDYVEYPSSLDVRHDTPRRWGGVSGGALWQVQLKRDGDTIVTGKRFLWGVPFYEVAGNGRIERIRCHGRHSIYGKAYEAIVRGHL